MEQFHAYSPEDIILSNLRETSERHACLFEQELAHLAELAEELIEGQIDETELLSAIPDFHLPTCLPNEQSHLPTNQKALNRLEEIHSIEQRVLLCDEMRKLLQKDPSRASMDFFLDPEKAESQSQQRIIYQKSSFSDTAFLQFASLYNAPRAMYAHSFQVACENVFNGICEFCILPIENNSEGKLIGFIKLIDQYSLKIAATCDVIGNDGTRATRFALLCKEIQQPLQKKNLFLEIAFPNNPKHTVTELLLAAQLCGLSLSRIDSVPSIDANEKNTLYHTVFSIDNATLPTFLLYLTMEIPQYSIVGIYHHIKK